MQRQQEVSNSETCNQQHANNSESIFFYKCDDITITPSGQYPIKQENPGSMEIEAISADALHSQRALAVERKPLDQRFCIRVSKQIAWEIKREDLARREIDDLLLHLGIELELPIRTVQDCFQNASKTKWNWIFALLTKYAKNCVKRKIRAAKAANFLAHALKIVGLKNSGSTLICNGPFRTKVVRRKSRKVQPEDACRNEQELCATK